MSEQMKESIEIHSLEELKKLIMEKDDNEILIESTGGRATDWMRGLHRLPNPDKLRMPVV